MSQIKKIVSKRNRFVFKKVIKEEFRANRNNNKPFSFVQSRGSG
jgi:hypothetical protein